MSSVAVACNERLKHSILTFDDAHSYFAMVESTPHIMNEAVVKVLLNDFCVGCHASAHRCNLRLRETY